MPEAQEDSSPNDRSMMNVRPGDVLASKYKIERVLGAGGMGVVVAAHHLQLDQRVAIKFLLPDALRNPEAMERFSREARAAARIRSEHVARVIDVGELDSGSPFIVMEYLEGSDLANALAARRQFSFQDAVDYVLQASEALAEAHAAGIVHRDLKPANLFLARRADGSFLVKVLDFGISKLVIGLKAQGDVSLTKTSMVMGSPMYMSPEQMRSSRDVDSRTDIWSLGAILYELLSGRPAFLGAEMPEVVARVLTEEPTALRDLRPDVPAGLEDVVRRCLVKDPRKRVADVAELARALIPFGSSGARVSVERIHGVMAALARPASVTPAPSATVTPAPLRTSTAGSWRPVESQEARSSGPRGRSKAMAIGAVVGFLLIAIGIAMFRTATGGARDSGSMMLVTPAPSLASSPAIVSTYVDRLEEPTAPARPSDAPLAGKDSSPKSTDAPAPVPASPDLQHLKPTRDHHPPPEPAPVASKMAAASLSGGLLASPLHRDTLPVASAKKNPLNIDIK